MSRMVEVVIDSVRVSLTNQQRIVVLRESNVERYLPIWIGPYEAEAITIALQEIEVARPQTHDLLKNLMQSINARLLRVEVIALREDVFFGNLVIELNDGQVLNIDCRPSDAWRFPSVHMCRSWWREKSWKMRVSYPSKRLKQRMKMTNRNLLA
jgi:uncharacterized protein